MRYLPSFLLASLFILLLAGCKKDKPQQPSGDNPHNYKYQLKSIKWDNDMVATMHYNNDNSIKKITYVNPPLNEAANFSWVGNNMVNMAYASSLYMNTFNYNNGRLVSVVNSYKDMRLPNGYKFEYAYNPNGTLAELKYFIMNEAGANLTATSTYDYKSNGDLQTIITTQPNGYKIKYTFESWSEVCVFNPWVFIPAALSDNYQFYNYPVLSKMNKLPAKLTQTVMQPGFPDIVYWIEESVHTVTNERLDKSVIAISYPASPEFNQTRTAVFEY